MLSAVDTADRPALPRVEVPSRGFATITELILDSPRQIPDALAYPSTVILTHWRRKAASAEFISTYSPPNIIFRLVRASRHVSLALITGGIFIRRAGTSVSPIRFRFSVYFSSTIIFRFVKRMFPNVAYLDRAMFDC